MVDTSLYIQSKLHTEKCTLVCKNIFLELSPFILIANNNLLCILENKNLIFVS